MSSQVTLYPTVPLTDYAKSNLDDLRFGPEPALKEPEATFEPRKLNCFGRCIKKWNENESRVAIISRLAVFILLSISIVGIPLVIIWFRELDNQHKDESAHRVAIEKLNQQSSRINARANIIENIFKERFKELPILDLHGDMGRTDYIDFLLPKELSAPIMKGVDKFGRPFIALKLLCTENPNPFVTVLFERYTNSDVWVWVSDNAFSRYFDEVKSTVMYSSGKMIDEVSVFFSKVINGQHEKFRLVH